MNDNYTDLEAVSQIRELCSFPPGSTSNPIPFRLNPRAILFLSPPKLRAILFFSAADLRAKSTTFSKKWLFSFKGGVNQKN